MGSHLKDEILLQKISTKLKILREKAKLTQEDVYNDTGIHISRIETGKVNITVSTLSALCDYFNLKLSTFFEKL